jgi:hypothetical protein
MSRNLLQLNFTTRKECCDGWLLPPLLSVLSQTCPIQLQTVAEQAVGKKEVGSLDRTSRHALCCQVLI